MGLQNENHEKMLIGGWERRLSKADVRSYLQTVKPEYLDLVANELNRIAFHCQFITVVVIFTTSRD